MKIYFTFFIILAFFSLNAQSVFNTELIQKLEEATVSEKINILILTKPNTEINSQLHNMKMHYRVGNIFSVSANKETILKLASQKNVIRIEYIKHHLQLMGDTAHIRNRIKNIKNGLTPLTQSYNGAGVIIGIIDSGTDFTHPDFKDASGKSRIKYLWDMSKPYSATHTPTAFGYGQEWTNTQIDLGQCTHNDLASYGHGTNSSGIAAGNGFSVNKYEGMASGADIIVVALDFNMAGFTIADAVQYIIDKSVILNKPLVINASVGDYYGSHDGTDLETQVINGLIANVPGRALIAACGNGGSSAFHVGYNIVPTDTNFAWIKNNLITTTVVEYADTTQIKNVKYRIGVTNLGFTDLGFTSFKPYNDALNVIKNDTIYHNTQRIGIVSSVSSINSFGVYELAITIRADSIAYLWSIGHTGTGRIDSWHFDYLSGATPPAFQYPNINHYKKADTLQSIVSGFQCSDEVIAVGNYINRSQYIDVNNIPRITNETAGQLHASSSTGPTRDHRIKPDITATGANIMAAAPLSLLSQYAAAGSTVVAQGGYHRTAGGTSAASPIVAGFAALYFQRQPTATNQQLKQAIINCAYHDIFTGNALPNNKWGYGKLDGFASLTCGEVLIHVDELSDEKELYVFPNPMHQETNVQFPNAVNRRIKLYNASGQLVREETCSSDQYLLKRNSLASGLYFLLAEAKNVTYKIKIVIL
ncbi:MAG: S8 family peptidase [Bacteroidota bacterium]